ncbi:MAG: SMI1/KNR4 family protein [Desulfobulbaceae bacterium]|nr:SMI1/KNR4 family protein [Desulfobulbaceae bacterium]
MWKENWNQFTNYLMGISSVVDSNIIDAPASNNKLAEIEKKFGIELPPKFKDFLLNNAGGLDIWWSLKDGALVRLEGEGESISGGYFNISLDEMLEMNFRIEDDYEPDEYDLEIHPRNLLAFAGVENGDQFAVVFKGDDIDSIKYISHDLDDIHLYTVGEDINSFLSHYASIGFAGCEYWIWEQFTNQRTTIIDSESPKAIEFLDAIKGGTRSMEAEEERKRMKVAMQKASSLRKVSQD